MSVCKPRIQGYVHDQYRDQPFHTICEEALCPNIYECSSEKNASYLILGKRCTRSCPFCNLEKSSKGDTFSSSFYLPIINDIKKRNLSHVVLTSPTRDDLEDCGAGAFASISREIHKSLKGVTVELLIPDMKGRASLLDRVIEGGPEIVAHNIETVPELYGRIRPFSSFERSLDVLRYIKNESVKRGGAVLTKSNIMVGLGEDPLKVTSLIDSLRDAGCDFLTIGQYLAPTTEHLKVARYYSDREFYSLKEYALRQGLKMVFAGALVRSSYRAKEMLLSGSAV
jgi:lipoic acid synthetase